MLLCTAARVLAPLIVAIVVLLTSTLLMTSLPASAATLLATAPLGAAVLSVFAMATLLLPGSLAFTALVALGSIGAAGRPLLVLCSALVSALDLTALVLAVLGLVILRLLLVAESGSLRRS